MSCSRASALGLLVASLGACPDPAVNPGRADGALSDRAPGDDARADSALWDHGVGDAASSDRVQADSQGHPTDAGHDDLSAQDARARDQSPTDQQAVDLAGAERVARDEGIADSALKDSAADVGPADLGTADSATPDLSAADLVPVDGASPVAVSNWLSWIDPAQVWEQPAPLNYRGDGNKIRLNNEFDGVPPGDLFIIDVFQPEGTYDGQPPHETTLTPTEMQRGVLTPTNVLLRRVADPADGSRMAFEYLLDKAETGWVQGEKFRSEATLVGDFRQSPWGTELWAAFAVYIPPEYLLSRPQPGYYNIIAQWHDVTGGMLRNPAIAVFLIGGDGVAADAKLTFDLKRYSGAGWPDNPVQETTVVHEATIADAPAANTWHYILFNYKASCGFADPVLGDIYGSVETPDGFVRVYYAAGETSPPVLVSAYEGWWGAPIDPSDPNAAIIDPSTGRNTRDPYPKCGLYVKTNFEPAEAGTMRRIYNRGIKTWRAEDNPGIDASAVLQDYRAR